MTRSDLAAFEIPVEDSIHISYHDLEVHACDVWCQGIVLLETLKILETVKLDELGHNSVRYIHTLTEALNLAFADREAYVGDPKFENVPTATLLSSQYAEKQRARIQMDRAFGKMPAAGAISSKKGTLPDGERSSIVTEDSLDTIYCAVVDRWGNSYSATLSDNARDTPIIPGTGLTVSSRGCQSRLQSGHPSDVRAGKRPRLTPSPGLVFRKGRFEMAFGTPGGDVQCQAMLQTLLNMYIFEMTVQQAIEAPRFASFSFPNSFAPHTYLPGRLCLESRLPAKTIDDLRSLGHDVEIWPSVTARAGAISAVRRDEHTHWLHAGADPRRESYAAAW